MKKLLFVCKGNICRSPLAHGLLEQKLKKHQIDDVYIDSSGTGHWHIGKLPDPRTIEVARKNNLDLTHLRSRQFQKSDFANFDIILTMDDENQERVLAMASNKSEENKVKAITSVTTTHLNVVDDPYHHGERNFDLMYLHLDNLTDQIVEALTENRI